MTTKKKENVYKDYVPRDVSWMYFNRRILQEAEKPQVPRVESTYKKCLREE